MESLKPILAKLSFFEGLEDRYIDLITGCASNMRFAAGEFLFREGEEAKHFFIIRHGRVAVEINTVARGPLMLYTHEENDVVGWSWLFPPYHWYFSARALELTRVIALDGVCLRGKCEEDPVLGYEFMKRFAHKVVYSLTETRMQLLDMYGAEAVTPPGRGSASGR
jgi:CRP/FNR family cyclic AMP-dependent transcriptional regulator